MNPAVNSTGLPFLLRGHGYWVVSFMDAQLLKAVPDCHTMVSPIDATPDQGQKILGTTSAT